MSHDFREQAREKHAENKMLILFEGRVYINMTRRESELVNERSHGTNSLRILSNAVISA